MQRHLLVGLTLANFVMLIATLAIQVAQGQTKDVPGVLRGRALQIVDDRGRVRASINVYPADPTVRMPDGTRGISETVLLRLINSRGGPSIKIDANEEGGGVMVGGAEGTYTRIRAKGNMTGLDMHESDGRERRIEP